MRSFLCSLLAATTLAACGGGSDDGVSSPRLYALDCGNIEVRDWAIFQPGQPPGVVKNLAVSCYLVVHPSKGVLLYDTGLGDHYLGKGQVLIQGFANFSIRKTLASQLAEIGYPPEKITHLAISHLHLDHTGNARLFPNAMHLVQKEEFAAAFESDHPEDLVGEKELVATLRNNPVTRLAGDHDVFGDGSAVIKRTAGHTPGHQSLAVKLQKSGTIVLSGDLAHSTENWVNKVVPGFNFDAAASMRSMLDIERYLLANDAVLWVGHDLEQNARIRHAPAFHE